MVDWMAQLESGDIAIIFATLLGPLLAVQTQKLLERRRDALTRKQAIFRSLMSTRAASLSSIHVEALNAIPIEFYGKRGKLKAINDQWKLYLDHHGPAATFDAAWSQKRQDLFLELLYAMAQYLGYDFTKSQIVSDIYSPRLHGEIENEQERVRKGLVSVLEGTSSIKVAINSENRPS